MQTNSETTPIETKPAESPVTAIATLDVRDASKAGLALMQERVKVQAEMIKLAISLTSPSQWTVFSGRDPEGNVRETVYPTGGAADTILRRAFGLTWGEKTITISDDGQHAACSAWLMQGEKRVEHFTGYRDMGGFCKTEANLRKDACENMKSVAVRDLLGLRFRTPEELRSMGLDVGKLKSRAEFQSHASTAKSEPGTITMPFGSSKGSTPAQLDDKSLEWYTKVAEESVADPSKSKWLKGNTALRDALVAEAARRSAGAAADSGPNIPNLDEPGSNG